MCCLVDTRRCFLPLNLIETAIESVPMGRSFSGNFVLELDGH